MNGVTVKLVVYVPSSHADAVRQAMGDAGAGQIGAYGYCSFSSPGTGRYKGDATTNPFIGKAGELTATAEERIEVTVARTALPAVIAAMKSAHPYEEIAFDVYPLMDAAAL